MKNIAVRIVSRTEKIKIDLREMYGGPEGSTQIQIPQHEYKFSQHKYKFHNTNTSRHNKNTNFTTQILVPQHEYKFHNTNAKFHNTNTSCHNTNTSRHNTNANTAQKDLGLKIAADKFTAGNAITIWRPVFAKMNMPL